MAAVKVFGHYYIRKGPPWAKRFGGLALGRLAFEPGRIPPHLEPYLFKKGQIKEIVNECRAEGKGGVGLVECIFTKVGQRFRKTRGATPTPTGVTTA